MTEQPTAEAGATAGSTSTVETPSPGANLANNQELIQRVAEMVPDENVNESTVHKVLVALDQAQKGAPLNTICFNPETGDTAHRVSRNGVHMWSITSGGGKQRFNLQPELEGWTCLHRPGETTESA